MKKFKVVGKNVTKFDAMPLARGKPMFADDIKMDEMLQARFLWSPHAHARIKGIDISEAEALPGVHAVLCFKNVPRVLHTRAGQGWPEPSPYDMVMFDNKVRYVGDRVAVVAAETEEIAEKALGLIKVDYEPLPAIFDPEKSMDEGAPVIHDEPDCKYIIPVFYEPQRNHCAHIDLRVGDVGQAEKAADFVTERKFKTHYGQHCTMEPHTCISHLDPSGRVVIRTSTQVPFYVRRIVAHCLQIPEKMIRVIKPRIGGGFGSKQEVVIEDVCAMLTMRTKLPVRLVYNREEVFVSSRTRHPMVMWAKTGVKKDGIITSIKFRVISNTGAYGPHAMTVMNAACAKALPIYRCENLDFVGDTVYTNMPNAGAYRGYGALQGSFAMAVMMDEMAHAIGMDPVEFWKMNTIGKGESHPIFKALGETGKGVNMVVESCSLPKCVDKGAKAIKWHEKRERYRRQEGPVRYGVGMSCITHGGTVAMLDMGSAFAKMNEDGSFNLLMGASDVGTGADTVLSQIFAETLDIPADDVIVYAADTDITPYEKGAYASGTTYISGTAVLKTAKEIKKQILKVAAEMLEEPKGDLKLEKKGVVSRKSGKRVEFGQIAKRSLYNKNQFQIAATASEVSKLHPQTYVANFAEVAVDTETGQVKVLNYVSAVDCGTPINPSLVDGQAAGAIINGIGYALTEGFVFDEQGRVRNPSFDSYKILSAPDIPKIKIIQVPSYEPSGPYGAKPVGEAPMDGVLPAISNAIFNAVGVRLTETPFSAERMLKAINEKKA